MCQTRDHREERSLDWNVDYGGSDEQEQKQNMGPNSGCNLFEFHINIDSMFIKLGQDLSL